MTKASIFIARIYDAAYTRAINRMLAPASIEASVSTLQSSLGDLRAVKWGDYQPALIDPKTWPNNGGGAEWKKNSQDARASLAAQPNYIPLSATDSSVPPNKADLLDAAIGKCFNTTLPGRKAPGIPIYTVVTSRDQNDPDSAKHDVRLAWFYDEKMKYETALLYTMVCPFPVQARKPSHEAEG